MVSGQIAVHVDASLAMIINYQQGDLHDQFWGRDYRAPVWRVAQATQF
jgi:hypothetical protein